MILGQYKLNTAPVKAGYYRGTSLIKNIIINLQVGGDGWHEGGERRQVTPHVSRFRVKGLQGYLA